MNIWNIIYLNCGKRYEDMIIAVIHSTYEIKAWKFHLLLWDISTHFSPPVRALSSTLMDKTCLSATSSDSTLLQTNYPTTKQGPSEWVSEFFPQICIWPKNKGCPCDACLRCYCHHVLTVRFENTFKAIVQQ